MAALAYLIQFIVIALIFGALMVFGFSWLSVLVGIIVYLLSTWMVSSLVQKKCPYCDSSISTKAVKCPKCQSDLPASHANS
ncbi:hypothetical protein [Vibrio alfacsensis]|uniref:hypothetical protein n=1 Tax=Vibrio alfacsensis TaxID=1074311 RepID=UPI001C7E27A6|nr:hypothetical protein [Vibrio alfacsensis]